MTDRPFAETKEQLGGFFLIEARDLNEAIRIASAHPCTHWDAIEIARLGNSTRLVMRSDDLKRFISRSTATSWRRLFDCWATGN